MTFAIRTLAAIAATLSLCVMGYAGDFSSLGLIALATGFSIGVCVPYAIAWVTSAKLQEDQIASAILAIGLIIAAALGLYGYYITFINNPKPDAQDGLVFLIIPLYQIGWMFLVWVIASFVKRLRNS
jgi:hypothetical protein